MKPAVTIKQQGGLLSGLKDLQTKLESGKGLRVGFLENATYPDGQQVAAIAALQEWGGKVQVPAHEITINRKIKDNGEFARGGKFVKAKDANFQTTHYVEAHTIVIPSRPFFRHMIATKSPKWGQDFANILKATGYDTARALALMGEHVRSQLMESIRLWSDPPNAASTIAKKGFDDPLVESSHMLNSVDYEVMT